MVRGGCESWRLLDDPGQLMAERRRPVSLRAASRLTGDAQMLDDHPGRRHQQRRDPLIFGKREDMSEQTPEGFARSFGQRRIGRMAVRGRRKLARPLPGLSEQVNSEVFLRQFELTRLLRRIHVSALSGLVVGQFRSYPPWDSSGPGREGSPMEVRGYRAPPSIPCVTESGISLWSLNAGPGLILGLLWFSGGRE